MKYPVGRTRRWPHMEALLSSDGVVEKRVIAGRPEVLTSSLKPRMSLHQQLPLAEMHCLRQPTPYKAAARLR